MEITEATRKKRRNALLLNGVECPGNDEGINRALVDLLQRMIDDGLTRAEISAKTGYAPDGIKKLIWRNNIVRRKVGTVAVCPCGCGRQWEVVAKTHGKIYATKGCRYRHHRALHAAGKLKHDEMRKCACGEEFAVFYALNRENKTCSKPECRWRISKNAGRKNAGKKYSHHERDTTAPKGCASRFVRRTYCTQKIDYDQVTCANYLDACGEGCYREEDGKPCCFVMPPPRPQQGFGYQAVNYCGETAMPGLRAYRR